VQLNLATNAPHATSRLAPKLLLGLALLVIVPVVFWPVGGCEFVNLDDPGYVTQNGNVQGGLTVQSIRGAFTSTTVGNWHPLTLLSLELDRELFGKGPAGFHWTNLALHAAAGAILFFALQRITASLGQSFWVAALFAVHPLHVESVAWISERKDVLSSLFFMLALWSYAWYTQRPAWPRYLAVFVSLALGLLAKPMLVTLPCVLLLLDYWPLRRLARRERLPESPFPCSATRRVYSFRHLLVEKLPLFLLAGLFCVITVIAQAHSHAFKSFEERSLLLRLQIAALACVVYLGKMFWPADLAPFYPVPEHGWPAWQVVGAVLLLLLLTWLAWRQRRGRPYLAVGWLWYLGMLVPVIGLVQVGSHAWADRYTYLPLIGIFIALSWGLSDLLTVQGRPSPLVPVLGALTLAPWLVLTRIQIWYWHDTDRLWQHTLAVTSGNDFAHNAFGAYLRQQGKLKQAREHFAEAEAINPRNDRARLNLINLLMAQGESAEAMSYLMAALGRHPDDEFAHLWLGCLYLREHPREALDHLDQARRLKPDNATTHFFLGQLFRSEGRLEEAVQEFSETMQREPDFAQGYFELGASLCRLGRWQEAAENLSRALELLPEASNNQDELSSFSTQQVRNAAQAEYLREFGLALYEMGEAQKAQVQYQIALKLQPDWPNRLDRIAWDAVTRSPRDARQGSEALLSAKKVCQATAFQHPNFLATLAATYAEAGQFREAVNTASRALGLATASNQDRLADQIRQQLRRYEQNRPLRQAEDTPAGGDRSRSASNPDVP
jgi:tetratricopeptide (TPR) repeat protein